MGVCVPQSFGFFLPIYCVSFLVLRLLIVPLVSSYFNEQPNFKKADREHIPFDIINGRRLICFCVEHVNCI